MPGDSLHWPIWVLYAPYTRTDYMYGWKALNENNGFTSAQATMNVPETLLYVYYLHLVYSQGTQLRATHGGAKPWFFAKRYVTGQPGALATMAAFTASVMTFSKTLLYGAFFGVFRAGLSFTIAGLNEAYSGWSNVGHNGWINLVFLWIIPK